MTKLEAQERFNWVTKNKARRYSANDVSVSIVKGDAISIVLRNGKKKLFDGSVSFAVFKNRVMFRSDSNGFSISGNNKSDNGYVKCRESVDELRQFIGDYELKYDDFYELYYIEKEEQ